MYGALLSYLNICVGREANENYKLTGLEYIEIPKFFYHATSQAQTSARQPNELQMLQLCRTSLLH